jgi:hypothetical protein
MPLPSFRSRFRRAAALALTASAMFGTQIAAFAQDGPPDEGDDTIEIVGWDLSDPVNRAESREFFAGLWAAQDAGLPPPAFEFTNLPPGLLLTMLLPELEVFTEIYRHRLQLDFDAGERYLVTDLIADDAEVRAEFRAFVLTGKLAPRPEIDAEAYLAHFELVIDAMTVQQRASIERVEALGVLVESQGMSVEMAEPTRDDEVGPPTPPWIPTDEIESRRCALRWLAERSALQCMYSRLYLRDKSDYPDPDFDCDDFADAMLRYLLRHLHGWSGRVGTIFWSCPDGRSDGHAVPVLIDPTGAYWWIEPKTGMLYGPFATEAALIASIRAEHPTARNCGSGIGVDQLFEMSPWNLCGQYGERAPWHTSLKMRERFSRWLERCCTHWTGLFPPCVPPDFVPTGERFNCSLEDFLPVSVPPPPFGPAPVYPSPCSPSAH